MTNITVVQWAELNHVNVEMILYVGNSDKMATIYTDYNCPI